MNKMNLALLSYIEIRPSKFIIWNVNPVIVELCNK